ncbi:hypothetical protein [Lacipirellula limnantheis]|uniref:Uncharacterized protein n=1 Tax=Lacipirellula limnantheis TaxID=2528024 RepID=A0A517U078_9BACT|nr:hypothetical protein [Lacipirellula limnantheis]QDT74037.1 hypothetical protein I41_32310 [Lacipirellula limnantheis]
MSVYRMAGPPVAEWQSDGETPRQWQQRQLAAKRERESAAKAPTPPAESPAEAYRKEAAKIVAEFGESGEAYVAAGMTYGESLAAERDRLTAERDELKAKADSRDRKAKGFAGRLQIGRNGFRAFGPHSQRSE